MIRELKIGSRCFPAGRAIRAVLAAILVVTGVAAAQGIREHPELSTRQLLDYYRSRSNPSAPVKLLGETVRDTKCGFWVGAQLLSHWSQFSATERAELSVLTRTQTAPFDTVVGHFRIHYDTSAANSPSLINSNGDPIPGTTMAYVDSVAAIFNHVWDVEISQMGYSAPQFELGQSTYNVYIEDLPYYGFTQPVDQVNGTATPPQYTSYIVVDNDFKEPADFNTFGLNALKVTAAHEFHHAIQYGYGFWSDDTYAYELTATWFEDVVYTGVNDYVYYLPRYFQRPSPLFTGFCDGLSFNSSLYAGYERCIWGHFLAKRYSPDLMREIWTGMRSRPFLESTDAVLASHGTDLKTAYAEFTHWNYFTADRADTVHFYPRGNLYPRFAPLQQTLFQLPSDTLSGNVHCLSSSMYEFDLPADTIGHVIISDSITATIANVEVATAEGRDQAARSVHTVLTSDSIPAPYQQMNSGLRAKIIVTDTTLWTSFYSEGIARDTVTLLLNAAYPGASPNPLRMAVHQRLLLPIKDAAVRAATVYFFSSSMRLAASGQWNVMNENGRRVILIPVSDVKDRLPSGVYFIFAKTAAGDFHWKLAVIR